MSENDDVRSKRSTIRPGGWTEYGVRRRAGEESVVGTVGKRSIEPFHAEGSVHERVTDPTGRVGGGTGRTPVETGRDRPLLSLLFLTWNAADVIEETLDRALAQTYRDYEIVVVDNGSADATRRILSRYERTHESVRVRSNAENLGFSAGMNRAFEASRGKYVACYNHDTLLPEDYLETVVPHLDPGVALTTARENHRVSTSAKTVRLLNGFGFPVPYCVSDETGVLETNYVPGDGLIVPRRPVETRFDGTLFDPSVRLKGEDVELSLRLRAAGIELKAVLDTYSIHPDVGVYALSWENLNSLYESTVGRGQAYFRHLDTVTFARRAPYLAASFVWTPLVISFGAFPRPFGEIPEGFGVADGRR